MEPSFHLGLAMAGAVSAGAYTGGVLDYLLQTLDAWEAAKGDNTLPHHKVMLDIISGASGGGITGAMAALAVHLENRNPITPDKRNDTAYIKSNVFYNAWVNLTQDDMLPEMLDLSDIGTDGTAVSLLNSSFIERLAAETLHQVPESTTAPPPYVSREMELILTLNNLEGFTYALTFAGDGSTRHLMKQHRDYAFFRLGSQYRGDGRIPLNLQQKEVGLTELVQAAPATGAFPIALAYRKLVRKKKYILDNPELVYYQQGTNTLIDPAPGDGEEDYVTYNVDGGMLNNEPFDLAMRLMAQRSADKETVARQELNKDERAFDSSIIMIDPFPSEDSISVEKAKAKKLALEKTTAPLFPFSIWQAAGRIFSSMLSELLFKGEDVVKAFSRTDFSRFMISPHRTERSPSGEEKVYNGSVAIACGALGGFSGFFDKSFREHDFYLGRTNCQRFLRRYFRVQLQDNVPVNPLFAKGYSAEAIRRFRFQDPLERAALQKNGGDPDAATWYVPIIPDVYKDDPAYDEVPPAYPSYSMDTFDHYKKPLLKRLKKIALTVSNTRWNQLLIHGFFLFQGAKMFRKLKGIIEKDFNSWNLLRK